MDSIGRHVVATKALVRERLLTRRALETFLIFLAVYLGWDAYALVYPYIGRWSINVLPWFLRLPMTSYHFEYSLVSWTVSHGLVHTVLRRVYSLGFSGEIMVTFLYLFLRNPNDAKLLAKRYGVSMIILATSFVIFHVYAPHVVYSLPEGYSPGDWTARSEFVLPSPHNTLATVSFITLLERGGRLAIPLLVFIALIPPATVLLGEHWFWDALTGILIGYAVSRYVR